MSIPSTQFLRRSTDWCLTMFRYFRWGAVVLLGLLVAGCMSDMGPVAYFDGTVPAGTAPVIQRGDKIKVSVYGEDNLNGIYDVDPNGSISIPLAGTIKATGRSKSELQHE